MRWLIVFFITLNLFAKSAESKLFNICENINITDIEIEFSKNEKNLICPTKVPGWTRIPVNQQLSYLLIFLENRGYFQSSWSIENDQLNVSANKMSFIKSIEFSGAPENFKGNKYRGTLGKPLTPENLSRVKKWASGRLASIGYPCATINEAASYKNENVLIELTPNEKVLIKDIEREPLEELSEGQFQRYDALNIGDIYNEDFLGLTSRRVIGSSLVSYTYFQYNCDKPGVLVQKFISKKPRLITFGIGGSSEELPILKVEWKNSRTNSNGSQIYSSAYASNIQQKLEVGSEKYVLNNIPRFSLRPSFVVERRKENIFESREIEVQLGLRYQQDIYSKRFIYRLVPSYSIENNVNSDLPQEIRLIQLSSYLDLTSNYFEYFRSSPRQGFQLKFNTTSYRSLSDSFDSNGQTFNLDGTYLLNINSLDPPSFILGFRFHYHTVVAQEIDQIPQGYRLYLGGQDNIRGFGRNAINNNKFGFKTTSHFATEARFTSLLPFGLEPLLFYDLAKVSKEAFDFTDTLYKSPGAGVRYESPIGNFRISLAKGYIEKPFQDEDINAGWNTFFSYGREF